MNATRTTTRLSHVSTTTTSSTSSRRYAVRSRSSASAARRVSTRALFESQDQDQRRGNPNNNSSGRVVNFSAGPACVYEDVLAEAQADLLNYGGSSGLGVMEMSHRGAAFTDIITRAEQDLRDLMKIPEDYEVLFMQGGASAQFAAIPLNLAWRDGEDFSIRPRADYLTTGSWSKKAVAEAKKLGVDVNVVAEGDNKSIPDASTWNLSGDSAKYIHVCANETIQGVEFKGSPLSNSKVPLVADMSSNFCSKPVNVSDFGVIYAGAQKNVGPAGVTIVIVRKDLLGEGKQRQGLTPTMLDWTVMSSNDSLYNTPPCFSIYMCGLVFSKLKQLGGLEQVENINKAKCGVLYEAIEKSGGFYQCPVDVKVRSAMNVPFTMPEFEDLEKKFVKEAEAEGLINLKGHRSVGGMRASIYNAMPMEGVEKLVSFMKDFQARHE